MITLVANYRELGFYHTRGDVGYFDIVFHHVDSHGFGEGVYSVFGCAINVTAGINFFACHGGYIDDMSFLVLDHQGSDFTSDVKKTFHVRVDHAFPVIQNSVLNRRSADGKSGVIYEYINVFPSFWQVVDGVMNFLLITNIKLKSQNFYSFRF